MYDKVSEDEGTSVWKYVADDGLTYLFTIGEYCKVSLMEITGDGLSLKATLKASEEYQRFTAIGWGCV